MQLFSFALCCKRNVLNSAQPLYYSAHRDSGCSLHVIGHIGDTCIHIYLKQAEKEFGKRILHHWLSETSCRHFTKATFICYYLQGFLLSIFHPSCHQPKPWLSVYHTDHAQELSSFITLRVTDNGVSRCRCSDLLASVRVWLTSTLSLFPLLVVLFLNEDVGTPLSRLPGADLILIMTRRGSLCTSQLK